MQCLTLAIENPAEQGEYRVFNQFEETYSILKLAEAVQEAGREFDIDAEIKYLEPPRVEALEHYYNPDHNHLPDLGYEPAASMEEVLREMFEDLLENQDRIKQHEDVLIPQIFWRGEGHRAEWLK